MPATLSANALRILDARYLQPGETPDGLWDRVSGGNPEYRRLMADLEFLPNSPTLFNMGTQSKGTLSACFVFDVDDSLLDGPQSIMATAAKAAAVAKAGGGVGYYFGHLRARGAEVNSTHRKACGPVQVLRYYHQIRALITQGGKRDLAQMGVLDARHPDIREFIHAKDADPKALESFNISVSWRDKEVLDAFGAPDGEWGKLWREQAESAWRTGDPGMLFWDAINRANATPHLGDINATNPCGETPNLSNEPCNLGSLALPRFVTRAGGKYAVDWDRLTEAARTATRFLDDILDWNHFPHPDIDKMARATRKLGLGVMGWADLLALLRIPYDSESAVDLADELMYRIKAAARDTSEQMAETKGKYPAYLPRNPFDTSTRNSTNTSIAPTGTIAILADCSSSIEPHYALEWTRTTNEGLKLTERIPVWDRLDGFRPKTAAEIDWRWHVRHQAAFQKHTDLGVSKTINMPNSATVEDISDAYRMMWETGCKGGTVYRDGCRSEQVLVAKEQPKSVYATVAAPTAEVVEQVKLELAEAPVGKVVTAPAAPTFRRKLPATRQSATHKFKIGGTKGYLTVGLFADGTPGEIFVRASKGGSAVNGMLDTWAMAFSSALQHGTPLADLVRLHAGTRFEPNGPTGNPDIPVCTSVPDYVVRWLERAYLTADAAPADAPAPVRSGHLCPDCGTETVYQAGCLTCPVRGCGWSRCG